LIPIKQQHSNAELSSVSPKKPKAGITLNALIDHESLSDGRKIRVARAKAPILATVEVLQVQPRTHARDSALIYAENRLSPWARWAKEHRCALGYPTISLLYQAMQRTRVGVMRGSAADPKVDEDGNVEYPLNADGHETRSYRPVSVGEIPEAIREVDVAVAALPRDLRLVVVAEYFTYGPMEQRCRQTRWKLARFRQLLESAKFAVYMALMAGRPGG
jgi:hypothetical protein